MKICYNVIVGGFFVKGDNKVEERGKEAREAGPICTTDRNFGNEESANA